MEKGYIIITIPLGLISIFSYNVPKSILKLMGEYNWTLKCVDNSQPNIASITYSERHFIFEKNLSQSDRLTDTLYTLFTDRYIYNEKDYKLKLETL